jgi:hypothetical protein
MPTIESVNLEPLEGPVADVASVPRRFGVGVLMILMTAIAVLFAAMKTLRAPPDVFASVAVLFLAVTLGQILLYQGKQPRQASIWTGAVVFPLEVYAWSLISASQPHGDFSTYEGALYFSTGMLIVTVPAGALFGYLAGCVMAGIFFVQEKFRRRSYQSVKVVLLPFTENDFDTLISWLRPLKLFNLWSRGQFRYPLDRQQLVDHLHQTANEPPQCLGFKAVYGEIQEMVAYIELANINQDEFGANITRAIVDPSRNDRDQLSPALVEAIVQHAFNQLGLPWLAVVLHRSEAQSLHCFRKHGFHDSSITILSDDSGDYQELIRSNQAEAVNG